MKTVLLGSLSLIALAVMAKPLSELPDGPAIKINDDGTYRVFCVATAAYDFNDPDDILDARQIATMRAKAGIAKFLREDIASEASMEKAVTKDSTNENGNKTVSKTTKSKTFESIRSSAAALLTGVVVLQDAKIPEGEGGYYKVMVGVSSKTQEAAIALKQDQQAALVAPVTPVAPVVEVVPEPVAPAIATPVAVVETSTPTDPAALPEGWYQCVGVGKTRYEAVQAALLEGVSMVYGETLERSESMSERMRVFRANLTFIKTIEGSAKLSEMNHTTNVLSKTAGFIREYRVISVIEKGDVLEATVHARIVNPRANDVVALLIHPPTMTTKLETTTIAVGPKKRLSGAEVGNTIATILPMCIENAQKFIVMTPDSVLATLKNKHITEGIIATGIAQDSESAAIGNALTPDYGLHVEVIDIKYAKPLGLNKVTNKFSPMHKMSLKLTAKINNERMGTTLKTRLITLSLDNEEITALLEENEDVDLLEAILMKLVDPIWEMINSTPTK